MTQETSAQVPVRSPGEYLQMHCSGFLYAAVVKWSNKKQLSGAAEMTQQLRELCRRPRSGPQHLHGSSQPPVKPVPKDPPSSSGLCSHQAYASCPYKHETNTGT